MPGTEEDLPLTPEQFTAARMLIARLRAEAAFEAFDFTELGIEWLVSDEVECARTDTGEVMHLGDIFHAAVVMLWSLVIAAAQETGTHPLEVIANLGLGLAQHDPT